jgi:methylated-DNA-[protein]-cysteine S-methyltransferase
MTLVQDQDSPSYILLPSRFGPFVLLWDKATGGPRVQRLLLPVDGEPTKEALQFLKTLGRAHSCAAMRGLAQDITRFLEGQDVAFPLEVLALERVSEFQRRVLRAEYAIPRGQVSTYGRIARHLGVPGGARAVGTALANNPFPILIPCHRVVRSDGSIGGYRGGRAMKQALLAMEEVKISPDGKVSAAHFY